MNRRQALFRITLAGTAVATSVSGYKWYHITKTPDLSVLDSRKDLLAMIVDTIIPRTDTPGALDTGVHEFVILMVKECTPRKEQNKFINGLHDLEEYCAVEYASSFAGLTPERRETVLLHFEKKGRPFKGIAGKAQTRFLGQSFFTTLKKYTAEGYCTSMAGATQGLAYNAVPGNYQGCTPLEKGQKGWATN